MYNMAYMFLKVCVNIPAQPVLRIDFLLRRFRRALFGAISPQGAVAPSSHPDLMTLRHA